MGFALMVVVAAVIEANGEVLACQRRRGGKFPLLWEFPGGKVQAGEKLGEALTRELREELGAESEIGPEIHRTVHRYAEMPEPTELVFFAAKANRDRVRNLVFERIAWRTPQSLLELEFLAADRELVAKLASGALGPNAMRTRSA